MGKIKVYLVYALYCAIASVIICIPLVALMQFVINHLVFLPDAANYAIFVIAVLVFVIAFATALIIGEIRKLNK